MHSVGRTRLPPASIEYRIASTSPANRRSSEKPSPCKYASNARRWDSHRPAEADPVAPLSTLDLPTLKLRRAAQHAPDERGRLLARKPDGDLHGLAHGYLRRHVVHVEHLVQGNA